MGWDNFRHTVIGTIAVASLLVICGGVVLQLLGIVEPIGIPECPPHFLLRHC